MIWKWNADPVITRDFRSRIPIVRIAIRVTIWKMWSWPQLHLEKITRAVLLSPRRLCHSRRRRPDWTHDIVRRMTQHHDRELWDRTGYYLKLTSWRRTRSFSSLYVHLTNVANDRSWTLVEKDWSRIIILIMSSLSTLWFYDTYRDRGSTLSIKSSTELSNLIHYFSWRILDWIMCTHE